MVFITFHNLVNSENYIIQVMTALLQVFVILYRALLIHLIKIGMNGIITGKGADESAISPWFEF